MDKKPSLFNNLTLLDWLLAGLFTIVVAVLGNSLFPGMGWLIGILIALSLLYLAKRRRDGLQKPPGEDQY